MAYIGNAPAAGLISGDNIQDGTVGTNDLANSAVTAAKLASTAVTDKLGYTPVNKAGDTITGQLTFQPAGAPAAVGIRHRNFGYGSSYAALQLGLGGSGQSVAMLYDPSTNASGNFDGNGKELVVPNDFRIIQPNTANDNFFAGFRLVDGVAILPRGQLEFPSSQNASSNANTLDDYEEGTWTPVNGGASGISGISFATHWYRKVGSLVVVSGVINYTASAVGTAYIVAHLPFPMTTNTDNICGVCNAYPYDNNRQSGIVIDNSSGDATGAYIGFYVSSTNAGNLYWSLSYRSS